MTSGLIIEKIKWRAVSSNAWYFVLPAAVTLQQSPLSLFQGTRLKKKIKFCRYERSRKYVPLGITLDKLTSENSLWPIRESQRKI